MKAYFPWCLNPCLVRGVLIIAISYANAVLATDSRLAEDSDPAAKESGFNLKKNARAVQESMKEMLENENQETINRFIAARVKMAGDFEETGLVGSSYKLLAETRNLIVEKRHKGFDFNQNEDSFVLMARSVSSALEVPDLEKAFFCATLFRKEIHELLKEKTSADSEALQLLDQHLYCLANKYVRKREELMVIREELLRKLPGSGKFQKLRRLISTENILELGEYHTWEGDYSDADKIYEVGERNGDEVASARRITCAVYRNRPDDLEEKLLQGMKSKNFRAVYAAASAYSLIEQSSNRIDGALEVARRAQEYLNNVKRFDLKLSQAPIDDLKRANRLTIYQWLLSIDKIFLLSFLNDIPAVKSEADLIQDIIFTWSTAAMSPNSTEQQRLRFKELIGSTPFDIWYLAGDPEKLAANLVFYKGMVMDSLILGKTTIEESDKVPTAYPPELAEELAHAESGIFKYDISNVKNVSHKDILAVLPSTSAFIDFAKLSGSGDRAFPKNKYVAVIYPQKAGDKIEIIDLGLAEKIESKISLFLALVESSHEDSSLEVVAKELAQILVSPWLEKIGEDKEEVILCPDGALSFLNFGALPDCSDKFLAEKIKVNYVSAARDMVAPAGWNEFLDGHRRPRVGIFVDPDFGTPPLSAIKELIASRRSTVLHRLPEARLESSAVIAGSPNNAEIELFSDAEATESKLRNSVPYWVLHLGTHGFFNKYASKNPMKAAGLAFAGAHPNLKAALNSEYDENPEDGILTAEEISKLDLSSCWLVSVSACQSGMGKNLNGEGVLGLRRGFYRSGVANLLLCLWPIGDKEARVFVENFYKLIEKNVPLKDVYPETMAKVLRQHADKKGITYAIRSAGPFVMSSVWKPFSDSK